MIPKPGRILVLFLFMFLATGVFFNFAYALDPQPEPPAPITIIIDGRELNTDVAPIIESGRTIVPLRAVFEALGARVNWNPSDQTISATRNNLNVQLKIGSDTAYKNDKKVHIDVPPRVVNGRTLVPLRFVSESLGG
ncbi:MAG: copper amine oxidase N-terminal domain-containing protein [Bacillota bacterium]